MAGYLLLLRWQLMRQRRLIPFFVAVQVVLGVGVIFGFSFLVPVVNHQVGLYLATGAAAVTLILIGLVAVPQEMAQSRLSGRQDYLAALPVPRLAPMLADITFWTMMQVPGTAITILLAVLRFHISLAPSPLVIPAVILTALTGAAVGCAIAMSLPAQATSQLTQFLGVAVLLFSPITYPLSRLPGFLQDLHRGLPMLYMADLVRGGLSGDYGVSRMLAFGVVGAWCVMGMALSMRAVTRRR